MGSRWPGNQFWAISVAFVSAGFVIFHFIKKNTSFISPLFLFLSLGYLSLQFWTSPAFSPHHVIHFTDGHAYEITGTVSERPLVQHHRTRLFLKVKTLSRNQQHFTSEGMIRVTLVGHNPVPEKGDQLTFTSRIRAIRNFSNPGGFDYERFMAFRRVWGSAYASTRDILLTRNEKEDSVLGFFETLQNRIHVLIDASGKKPATGVLKALTIGDKSSIPETTRNAFVRAGLGHLLAISGLHVGIVASLSFFLFRWLLSYSLFLCRHAWVDKASAVWTVIPVLYYGMISGMSPSTQRAVTMTIIFLLAFQLGREHDLLNTLAVAALVILIIFPPALFSVSFQLSFTAVAAIILGLSIFPQRFRQNGNSFGLKWRRRCYTFLWVSLFAIIGTMPLTLYYFHQMSLVGILANCIAVPLIGFVVVPVGITASLIASVSSSIAAVGFKICIIFLSWGIDIIDLIAGFKLASIKSISPSVFEIGVFYVLFWSVCSFFKHPKVKWVLVAALVVMAADGGYWVHRRLLHNDFRVTVLDVGQGTASLLEFPKGYTMLIDGGGFSDNASFDVGERIVAPYLWQNKISTVDTLVLSHPNSDHLNGLIYIAENFHVKNLWSNHEPAETFGYKRLMAVVKKRNIRHPDFGSIPRTIHINGVETKILHPEPNFDPEGILAKVKGENNNSLVVKTTFGDSSILFSGDIQETAEREILYRNRLDLASTVLVCPHHGSKSSSTPQFVTRVNPDYVIITAGWQNRFHFPHQEVLERYQKQGSAIFRTDIDGAVRMISNGKNLWIAAAKGK